MRARYYCPACLERGEHAETESGNFACGRCGRSYAAHFGAGEANRAIERCAFCGGRAFFRQKDFDQRLGCLILVASLAAALWVGWRFGWIWFTPVLLATAALDWVLAGRIRDVTICYRCDAEYRDVTFNPAHRGYDPHIAERYARRKTVGRMR